MLNWLRMSSGMKMYILHYFSVPFDNPLKEKNLAMYCDPLQRLTCMAYRIPNYPRPLVYRMMNQENLKVLSNLNTSALNSLRVFLGSMEIRSSIF